MGDLESPSKLCIERTRSAFLWKHVLTSPFWAIYTMLPFFMYKDLHATPFQIMLIIALKPAVSFFSLYWGAYVNNRPDRLVSSLIWGSIIGHLPFFFAPWVSSVWYFVAASALYMLMARGVVPAWSEILKRNLPDVSREKIFAYGSAFYYCCSGVCPFLFGWLMDDYFQAWRWILPATALLSLSSIVFQLKIPINLAIKESNPQLSKKANLHSHLFMPWKKIWALVRERPDFMRYQIGFMLAGGGIMIVQPALPVFFMDVLHISYMELGVAITLCKGIGFALASPFWAMWMNKVNIFNFIRAVTFLSCFYFLGLMAAQYNLVWLYIAYLGYGIMQSGSELGWNLSGPVFSKTEDSSLYSSINVVTVGIRGCIAPPLGSLILLWGSSTAVMVLGLLLCIAATFYLTFCDKNYFEENLQSDNVV